MHKIIIVIIASVIALYAIRYYKSSTANGKSGSPPKFTVLGTEWCGYTTKQRKHLDDKYGKGSHTYIDCDKDKGKCEGLSAFPVTRDASGKETKGFNKDL